MDLDWFKKYNRNSRITSKKMFQEDNMLREVIKSSIKVKNSSQLESNQKQPGTGLLQGREADHVWSSRKKVYSVNIKREGWRSRFKPQLPQATL